MTDFVILRNLGIIVFTAAVAVLLLRFVRVPSIVAYMVAGLVLGPIGGIVSVTEAIGDVAATEPLDVIADAGVALLLFLVGLELSLEHIRGVGRVAVIAGAVQIVATALITWVACTFLGLGAVEAAVIALAVTFSSTVVVVKMLEQRRELTALHGRIAVGILLVQDAAVVLTLTLFAGLGAQESGADVTVLATGVLRAFAGMAALAVAAAVAARYVLPRVFGWAEHAADTLFVWSLAWCFLFIVLAEWLHLSVELGAFIAGVALAQLHFSAVLRRRVQPIVNFFLAIFFVTLGLRMELGAALAQWPFILVLTAVVLLVKPLILLLTVPRLGYGPRTSFLTSITLAQMSEFSFILAAMAAGAGILTSAHLSAISVTGLLTIAVSSYAILASHRLYDEAGGARLMARLGGTRYADVPGTEPIADHIVVVGMNTLGLRLVAALAARGEVVLAIDTDAVKLAQLNVPTLLGTVDDPAVLDAANYTRARLVISALQIEDTNSLLAHRCHQAGVPASIHAFDASLIDELRDIGVAHLIVSKHDGTREIALRLQDAGVLDG